MAAKGAEAHPHATRLMLVVADGCRVGVALDSVDGVYDLLRADAPDSARLPDGLAIPLVAWNEVAGVPPPALAVEAQHVMVVRTASGPIGFAADACLGVRDVSFAKPPLPTSLVGSSGDPLCLLLSLDRRPHFLLDPRALADALSARVKTTAHEAASGGAGAG